MRSLSGQPGQSRVRSRVHAAAAKASPGTTQSRPSPPTCLRLLFQPLPQVTPTQTPPGEGPFLQPSTQKQNTPARSHPTPHAVCPSGSPKPKASPPSARLGNTPDSPHPPNRKRSKPDTATQAAADCRGPGPLPAGTPRNPAPGEPWRLRIPRKTPFAGRAFPPARGGREGIGSPGCAKAPVAVSTDADDGRVGSHRFMTCVVNPEIATSTFLRFFYLSEEGLKALGEASPGGAGRNRTLGITALEAIEIPVPPLPQQQAFDALCEKFARLRAAQQSRAAGLSSLMPALLDRAFKGEL